MFHFCSGFTNQDDEKWRVNALELSLLSLEPRKERRISQSRILQIFYLGHDPFLDITIRTSSIPQSYHPKVRSFSSNPHPQVL